MKFDSEFKAHLIGQPIVLAVVLMLGHISPAFRGLMSHGCNAIRWLGSQFTGKPVPLDPPAFTPSYRLDAITFGLLVGMLAVMGVVEAIRSRRQTPSDPSIQEPST